MLITRSTITLLLISLALVACDEPKEVKPPVKETKQATKEAPKEKTPPADPLAKARTEAETLASDLVLPRADLAQIVASDIETASKVPASARPRIKGKKTSEKATGSIPPAAANRVFRNFDGAMKKCYERALKRTPGLEGKVELQVLVSKDGSVRKVRAKGASLRDASVNKCLETTAKRMKFPAPSGGLAKISKRYSFSPAF